MTSEGLLKKACFSPVREKRPVIIFINIQNLTSRIVHTESAESDWVMVKIESRTPVIPRRETCEHSFLHKLHLITISAKSRLDARARGELAYALSFARYHERFSIPGHSGVFIDQQLSSFL